MTTPDFIPHFSVWRRWCAHLPAAVITGAIALSATGCSTPRNIQVHQDSVQTMQDMSRARTDSTFRATRILTREAVKGDTATLSLPIQSLRDLPPDAAFARVRGRARIRVERRDSAVLISASCDSLQREVEFYSALSAAQSLHIRNLQSAARRQTLTRQKARPPSVPWRYLFPVLAAAAGWLAAKGNILSLLRALRLRFFSK